MNEAHGAGHAEILLGLFLIYAAAKLSAELFERLRQPAVVGEILAGVLIGPALLGWVRPNEITSMLAEIGVMFLLFSVGLETRPSSLLQLGGKAARVGILGVIVPFAAGWACLTLWGASTVEAVFAGAALVATSVGITARVLGGMGLLQSEIARVILGAAIFDDILGLLILALATSMAAGDPQIGQLAATAVLALLFVGGVAFIGTPLLTRIAPALKNLRIGNALFAVAMTLCLGLAVAADFIGVAAIIGAFLAGVALSETAQEAHDLHEQTRGVTEFLVPIFLVNIGMQLDINAFADSGTLMLALLLTVLAVLSKIIGCGAGAWDLGRLKALQVGVGMVPRGEVGIVVAQIGLAAGAVSGELFAVVLFMAVATTLIAPPLLKHLLKN